jgi:hypothetical protein
VALLAGGEAACHVGSRALVAARRLVGHALGAAGVQVEVVVAGQAADAINAGGVAVGRGVARAVGVDVALGGVPLADALVAPLDRGTEAGWGRPSDESARKRRETY